MPFLVLIKFVLLHEVYPYAFFNCNSIKKVVFNEPLIGSYLRDGAFINSNIEEIDLSKCNKLERIWNYTFYNMENLKSVLFPENGMLKEIHEEEDVLHNTINEYVDTMENFLQKMPDFTKYKKIHIVACGSAMHAGLIGKYLFENYSDIETTVEIASEYRYKKVFYNHNDTLVILISQSGETADTIACLRKAKESGIDTLAIVNVVSSTIAREADQVLYIRAGVEIAVATTKAYLLQVAMLMLINLKMMVEKSKINDENKTIIKREIQ